MSSPKLHHETKPTKRKANWLNLVVAAFVVASFGAAGFLGWQNYSHKQQQAQLLLAIESQKKNLIELKDREQIGERMRAAEVLVQAQNYRQNWSEVVETLNTAIVSKGKFNLKSVSVTRDGQVSLNAETTDLLSAAGLLLLIERSDELDNGFIQSVSPVSQLDASRSYSVNATFNYLNKNSDE